MSFVVWFRSQLLLDDCEALARKLVVYRYYQSVTFDCRLQLLAIIEPKLSEELDEVSKELSVNASRNDGNITSCERLAVSFSLFPLPINLFSSPTFPQVNISIYNFATG